MGKRQKIILVIYVYIVMLIGFLYVPYVRYHPNGSRVFIGHHLKPKILALFSDKQELWGSIAIDGNLIVAEIFAITAIVGAAYLLLKKN